MPGDSTSPPSHGHQVVVALLITVLVLLALLIVIPNLLVSRRSPGESSSVSGVRTINVSAITYASLYPKVGFPPSLAALGSGGTDCSHPTEQHACLVDDILAAGEKSGYRYRYAPVKSGGVTTAYTLHADPIPQPPSWLDRLFHTQPDLSHRHFFSDESGIIRSEMGREAGPQSPPLG
ncbi:MAG TPA: hypothetical protein VE825_05915 [Terriglobales bacterium]|jgi:hypothetical protein|nr:hypothetical protein [Terriglobales bacterium]